MNNLFSRIVLAALGVWLSILAAPTTASGQSIVITNLPAYGTPGYLSGYVTNANVTTNCVMVFIFTGGDWYSEPGCSSQSTPIQPNGTWTANITPNSNAETATEIAVFLVPTNYNPACVNGASALTIPPQAEAVVYADRVATNARQFDFSGYGWWVKTSSGGLAGPGPNYFSDSTNNAWVDAQGYLHLQITHTNSGWQCVEIISDRNFGYGRYRFTVSANVDNLDANAVLGMFTWSYDAAYNYREIDMELSRWDYAFGNSDVEDYAVSPYNAGQTLRFPLPTGVTNSTHTLIWQSNNVAFQTVNGSFSASPASSNILETWACTNGIPPAGGEQVHINLWLDEGNPPAGGQPVEVTLTQFEFVPLGPPPPATLNPVTGVPPGPAVLSGQGVMDWHYEILSSSNLVNWLNLGTVLATSNSFQFTDTNPATSGSRYYRVLTEP